MLRQLAIWTAYRAACVTPEQLLSSGGVLHAAYNAKAVAVLELAALKPGVVAGIDLFPLPSS